MDATNTDAGDTEARKVENAGTDTGTDEGRNEGTDTDAGAIEEWCRKYLADLLGTTVEQVDPGVDFDRLGVDSTLAVSLLVEVEDRYGVDLEPEVLFATPTIRAVSIHLQQRIEAGR